MTNESDRSMRGGGWSDSRVRPLVETVWNYHHVHHELAPADAILVLCSHDTVVAERGAQLWLEGWAPLLIFPAASGRSRGISGRTRRRTGSPALRSAWAFPKIAS